MNEKTTIEAKILGKYYTITADEPEEYIYKICSKVDKMVSDILSKNPRKGAEMSAILTAINVTDDLMKAEKRIDNLQRQIMQYNKEIAALEGKIRELSNKLERRN